MVYLQIMLHVPELQVQKLSSSCQLSIIADSLFAAAARGPSATAVHMSSPHAISSDRLSTLLEQEQSQALLYVSLQG